MHSDMQGPQERCFSLGLYRDTQRTSREPSLGPGRGRPVREYRRVTLPHPAGCSTITVPGLSFRVRKGTGRHTWAMATAKTTTDGPDPQNRDPDRPKKTTHAPPPARAVTVREPDSGREHRFVTTGTTLLVANNPAAAKTRTHPHTQEGEWAAMSPSPVSTGRLHPSRGFHLRPIKHVFHMRASTVQDRKES